MIDMLTLIAGTNRPNSATQKLTNFLANRIQKTTDLQVEVLDLSLITHDWIHSNMYQKDQVSPELLDLIEHFLRPSSKWIFITPEYNGSYPGIVKTFLDAISVTPFKKEIYGRKAALLGVASGRAGNLRGMEHLTGVLNYLGLTVYPDKIPFSSIKNIMDEDGNITHEESLAVLDKLIERFSTF
jgi:NAD(P)H-dependent FMN reductase